MYNESNDFLARAKSARINIYAILAAAHIIFGMRHQESVALALATIGFVLFTTLVCRNAKYKVLEIRGK